MSGRSSLGQMNAFHSKSLRFSNRPSSSDLSYGPRRLQRTRYWGGATVEIGSICRKPKRRTVSRTFDAEPSRSCARTAILRPSSGVTSTGVDGLIAFVLSQLPPAPARVLEVGCGDGEVSVAVAGRGYEVV